MTEVGVGRKRKRCRIPDLKTFTRLIILKHLDSEDNIRLMNQFLYNHITHRLGI